MRIFKPEILDLLFFYIPKALGLMVKSFESSVAYTKHEFSQWNATGNTKNTSYLQIPVSLARKFVNKFFKRVLMYSEKGH